MSKWAQPPLSYKGEIPGFLQNSTRKIWILTLSCKFLTLRSQLVFTFFFFFHLDRAELFTWTTYISDIKRIFQNAVWMHYTPVSTECHMLFEKSRGSSWYCWMCFKNTLVSTLVPGHCNPRSLHLGWQLLELAELNVMFAQCTCTTGRDSCWQSTLA